MANRWLVAAPVGVWVTFAAASPSRASLVISDAPTQGMHCAKGQCFPNKRHAVLNVEDLQSYLQNGTLLIDTRNFKKLLDAQNIRILGPLHWSAATTLELGATSSVTIDRKISVDGPGSLAIYQGSGSTGHITLGPKGRIRFRDKSSQFTADNIQYTLVKNIKDMAGAAASGAVGVALMDNFDASADGTYTQAPVRPTSGYFSVEGLGNSLSNITIVEGKNPKPGNVGLISTAYQVLNLHVLNIAVTSAPRSGGYVGGIVGEASTLANDTVSGSISADGLTAGGLAGRALTVLSSTAHVAVTAAVAGGLIGEDDNSSIQLSSASGPVVSEGGVAGGLVGHMSGGTIEQSFATGSVAAQDNRRVVAGGLVGLLDNGNPSGNAGSVRNCYASGAVTAGSGAIGGLVGTIMESNTASAYANGMIANGGGGYAGKNQFGNNVSAFWDTTASGTRRGAGDGSESGIVGRTTKQLKSALPAGFNPAIWAENAIINNGYPYLINNPPQ